MATLPDDTRQKSVLLARAMGWEPKVHEYNRVWKWSYYDTYGEPLAFGAYITWSDDELGAPRPHDPEPNDLPDLYAPENMALAWRVATWAYEYLQWLESDAGITEDGMYPIWSFRIEKGQPALLDSILARAIEAGLVEHAK